MEKRLVTTRYGGSFVTRPNPLGREQLKRAKKIELKPLFWPISDVLQRISLPQVEIQVENPSGSDLIRPRHLTHYPILESSILPMLDARDSVVSSAPASSRRSAKNKATVKANLRGSSSKASASKTSVSSSGKLPIQRVFSDAKVKPFDQIEWDRRTAEITDDSGKTIFKQEGVEVPKNWSVLATKVVCSKYFYGDPAKAEREKSVKQLIHRVTRTIADWGVADGYFSKEDGEVFYDPRAGSLPPSPPRPRWPPWCSATWSTTAST